MGVVSRRMLIGIDVDLCMLKFVLICAGTCLVAYLFFNSIQFNFQFKYFIAQTSSTQSTYTYVYIHIHIQYVGLHIYIYIIKFKQ